MDNNLIFIHIPKTGGTTINSAMQGTYWQTTPDFYYRHIILESKKSNCGDIFEPENFSKFKNYKLFMMLRHPVDRMISEYYFIHDREEFMNLLQPKPSSFEDYVEHSQTPNYTLGFLIGDRIYDKKRPTRADLERVKLAIQQIPIHTGIFEFFADSLEYFSKETGIEWAKNIEAKRVTFSRPKANEISAGVRKRIEETNALDMELYDFCLERFKQIQKNLPKSKISFEIDKYNHVIPYVSMTCLFEYFMDNKTYIKQNFRFFKDLTFFLLKNKKIKDGKRFTIIWNQVFVETIKYKFPNSPFYETLQAAFEQEEDPLNTTGNIAKALDDFFKSDPQKKKKYYQELTFTPQIIIEPKLEKKGFFKSLFSK